MAPRVAFWMRGGAADTAAVRPHRGYVAESVALQQQEPFGLYAQTADVDYAPDEIH